MEKLKIELPAGWDGVTINQFQQLSKIKKDDADDLAIEPMIEMISVLSGIERQKLYEVSFSDILSLWKVIGWMSDLNFKTDIVKALQIEGVTYQANLDVRQMSAGQLIDLKHYLKDGSAIDNMHNILSIFYIPKGKKYNEVNIADVAEVFQSNLSIAVAYPLQVFFCARLAKWKSLTNTYTRSDSKKRKEKGLRHLLAKRKRSMSGGAGL